MGPRRRLRRSQAYKWSNCLIPALRSCLPSSLCTEWSLQLRSFQQGMQCKCLLRCRKCLQGMPGMHFGQWQVLQYWQSKSGSLRG